MTCIEGICSDETGMPGPSALSFGGSPLREPWGCWACFLSSWPVLTACAAIETGLPFDFMVVSKPYQQACAAHHAAGCRHLTPPALRAQHDFDVAVGLVEAEEAADAAAGDGGACLGASRTALIGQKNKAKAAVRNGKPGKQAAQGDARHKGGKPARKDMNWRKGRGVFR